MNIQEVEESANLIAERGTILKMIKLAEAPSSFSIRFEHHDDDELERSRIQAFISKKYGDDSDMSIEDIDEYDLDDHEDDDLHPVLIVAHSSSGYVQANLSDEEHGLLGGLLRARLQMVEHRLAILGVDLG